MSLTYKKLPKEKASTAVLEAKLWKIFSEYIRLRASDFNGIATCFTCDRTHHWKYMEAGHCIGGRGNAILFDEIGTQCQCPNCNRFLNGNYKQFRINLDLEFGEGTYLKLLAKSKEVVKFTPALLKNNIEYYTQKVNEHKTRIGIL